MKKIILVIFTIFLSYCTIYNDSVRRWEVPPGNHFSIPFFDLQSRTEKNLTFRFKINDHCNSFTKNCPEQINKLIGISDRPVVKNDRSVILGWNTDKNRTLRFWNFINYNKGGNFKSELIMVGKTNTWYTCSIIKIGDDYIMEIDGNTAKLKSPDFKNKFLYLVEPYFGGRCTNPSNGSCLIWVEIL